MSLKYCIQASAKTLVQATLTASYDAPATTTVIKTGLVSQGVLDIAHTRGAAEAASGIEVRIRTSSDGITWFNIVNESITGGVSTLVPRVFAFAGAAGGAKISLPIDLMYQYIEVSIRETGVVTNYGKVDLYYTLSGI